MKICAISDTHDQHRKITIPEADILLVAGDFTCHREPILQKYTDFYEWLKEQPAKHKIVVAGNHDTLFEKQNDLARKIFIGVTYLQDSGVEIEGLKIWGSPVTPFFADWAFMEPDNMLKAHWDLIPNDTDILVTHGGPYGILDKTGDVYGNVSCGSKSLTVRLRELNLKLHVFGHIHESYGKEGVYVNAAQCDEMNNLKNEPIIIEI